MNKKTNQILENSILKKIILNLLELMEYKALSKDFKFLNKFTEEEFNKSIIPLILYSFNKGLNSFGIDDIDLKAIIRILLKD